MRILIDIAHPGHVHFFKNMVWNLQEKGHEIMMTASEKEVSLDLLNAYGLPYRKVGASRGSLLQNLVVSPLRLLRLYRVARRFKPDLLCGVGNPFFTLVGKILGKPTIVFDDTELNPMVNIPTFFLATVVCTPSCFKKDLGKKQVRYNGYHELAYSHPNYFMPNPAVLDGVGLSKDDTFIILRFVSWRSPHDVGRHGIRNKIELVRELKKYGRVFITSEGKLEKNLEKYKIKVAPEKLHDLLYYASLYVGDGGTTASEAAVLGTHAIHISTAAKFHGVFQDLDKCGLMWNYGDDGKGVDKAVEVLQKNNIRKEGKRKREKLLKDKINVTAFMAWFIENYPESFRIMKENPEYQDRFRSKRSL